MRIVLMIVLCLALASAAHARDLTKREQAIIIETLHGLLTQPDATTYRFPPLQDSSMKTDQLYCAWLNPKGTKGNYLGTVPFLVRLVVINGSIIRASAVIVSDGTEASVKTIMQACADYGSPL